MINKKKLFYILSFFLFVLIIEAASWSLVNVINNHPLIIKSKNFYRLGKINNELNEYSNFIPYIDDSLNFEKNLNNKINKNLFFKTHRKFDKQNNENILIQGDSWAAAGYTFANNKIHDIAEKKNFLIINAGKISYSISPMNVQLDILTKKFNIKPTIIIAIIDQTDIGDELHRYQSLNRKNLNLIDTKVANEFKGNFFEILEGKKFNTYKLFLLSKQFWLSRLHQFNFDYSKTISYIFKRLFYLVTDTPIVIAPLKFGINEEEEKVINKRFEKYINNVFINKIEKLIFVTHPHKNHFVKKKYIENISTIVDYAINNSSYKNKILHINFEKDFQKIYPNISIDEIFLSQEEDLVSHLREAIYRDNYFPYILSKCCK